MRKWELLTSALDPAGDTPLFLQLANALAEAIAKGRLKPGEALPGTRSAATKLHVHRNTVIASYRELEAQGLVWTRAGGGTFVAERPHGAVRTRLSKAPARALATYSLPDSLPELEPFPADPPGALSFVRAIPDFRLLPADPLARAYRAALKRHGRKLLGVMDPRGHERLRSALAKMLSHARALPVTSASVMVTRGSQQAIYLLARTLFIPGDTVVVEALGNPSTWAALRQAQCELIPLPVDEDGLDVDLLEKLLARRKIRAVYVTPHHQFPTNVVMPEARRERLGRLSLEHRFLVLEDDYDHEFHYEGKPLQPLAGRACGANTVYLGSLSKVLAPGLRCGYVVAPPDVLERLARLRQLCDLHGDAVSECAVAELFEDGELIRHIRRMRETYLQRRDALAAALTGDLGGVLEFRMPDGGMAIWAKVRRDIDVAAWSKAGEARGVLFLDAGMFDFAQRDLPFLRLGFTFHNEVELAEGVARMARALPRKRTSRSEPG